MTEHEFVLLQLLRPALLLIVLSTFVIEAILLVIDAIVVIVIVVGIHIVLVIVVGILQFSFQVLIKELVLLLSILPGSGRIKNN